MPPAGGKNGGGFVFFPEVILPPELSLPPIYVPHSCICLDAHPGSLSLSRLLPAEQPGDNLQ